MLNQSKPFWQSTTFYGSVLAILSPVLLMAKIDIGEPSLWVSAIGSVVGGIVALVGRFKAVKRIG